MVEAIRKGLESFEVPQQDGHNVITITYTVNSDSSITLPRDLTPRQADALRAYFTYDNQHMEERHGAHLSVMSEEQSNLLDTVIDAFKTPEQVERERIRSWVLSQHTKQVPTYKAFMSWFEETYSRYKDEWVAEGACSQEDMVYDVHITESYDGTFSYRQRQVTTLYFVAVQPDTTIKVLHSRVEKQSSDDDEDE